MNFLLKRKKKKKKKFVWLFKDTFGVFEETLCLRSKQQQQMLRIAN